MREESFDDFCNRETGHSWGWQSPIKYKGIYFKYDKLGKTYLLQYSNGVVVNVDGSEYKDSGCPTTRPYFIIGHINNTKNKIGGKLV